MGQAENDTWQTDQVIAERAWADGYQAGADSRITMSECPYRHDGIFRRAWRDGLLARRRQHKPEL